jgi:hypothetical protein
MQGRSARRGAVQEWSFVTKRPKRRQTSPPLDLTGHGLEPARQRGSQSFLCLFFRKEHAVLAD